MNYSTRYVHTLVFALATLLVWPTMRPDECKAGCDGNEYEEAGREDNYNLFTDKPADDFREGDRAKRTERDDAIGRERRPKKDRKNKHSEQKEERRRKREERKNRKHGRHKSSEKSHKKRDRTEKTPKQSKRKEKKEERRKVTKKPAKKSARKDRKKPKKEEKKPAAILAEDIERNRDILEGIYAGITGFERLKPGEHEEIVSRGGFPTYGEITYDSWQAILNDLQKERNLPGPKDKFIDFGCGVGKTPMQTYLNTPVASARGVDLSKTRLNRAIEAHGRLEEMGLIEKGRQLEYKVENMLEANLKGVTLAYTCSTCFSHELMHGLMEKLSKLKKGLIFLTLKELPDDYEDYGFKLVKIYQLPMTWAKDVPVHMYELVGKPKKKNTKNRSRKK